MIRYHTVASRESKKCPAVNQTWEEFATLLMKRRDNEYTMIQWKDLPKTEKDIAKDKGGFLCSRIKDNLRDGANVESVTTLKLDADDAFPCLPLLWEVEYGFAAVIYPTANSTPSKPRNRVIAPVSREMTTLEAEYITKVICSTLGAAQFDISHSVSPIQIMYWGSVTTDGVWNPIQVSGAFLDVDAFLAPHPNWQDRSTWPEDAKTRERALAGVKKADPTLKPGLVGDFCRVHGIASVIEEYLPEVYAEGDNGRYSYAGGTTRNGAIVYDNGHHLWSEHEHDPAKLQCLNAFDLVRIHRGLALADMMRLAQADLAVQALQIEERFAGEEVLNREGGANPALFFRQDGRQRIFTPLRMADWYSRRQPCAVMEGVLYQYVDGRYVPAREDFQAAGLVALGDEWTSFRTAEVLTCLTHSSRKLAGPWSDPYLNVKNGLLNVQTGELIPHDPLLCSTLQLPWGYDPSAACPTVDTFLSCYAAPYSDLVWDMFGYLLMGSKRMEMSFMLLGTGGNGKGTILELVNQLLGFDNVSHVDLQTLEANSFAASELVGKMANVQSDLPSTPIKAKGMFKQITAGDTIRVERKGKDGFSTKLRTTLVFSANKLPKSHDNTYGFYRKWTIFPFTKDFGDRKMRAQLFNEIPGVLAKAVLHAQKLITMDKFPDTGSIDRYRMKNDEAYAFIKERMQSCTGTHTPKHVVYEKFMVFSREQGVSFPILKKEFDDVVAEVLKAKEYRTKNDRCWMHLAVVDEDPAFDDSGDMVF